MRWARLWLSWFVAAFLTVFGDELPPAWRRSVARQLDRVAAMVAQLIILHVAQRLPARTRASHRHGQLKQRGRLRTIIGARLRRAMRAPQGKHSLARLGAILTVLRDAERHVAHLARRLRCGLTRLRTIAVTPEATALAPARIVYAIAGADTS